jgi:hypothetical protein
MLVFLSPLLEVSGIIKDFAWIAGGTLTFITFVKGIMEYTKSNRIKRTEFLEKLIAEFNDRKMFLAKKILDDFWFDDRGLSKMSDEELIRNGSKEVVQKPQMEEAVIRLLRNHASESVTGYGEQKVRQSLDDLLDFFARLDYYVTLRVIGKEELVYFIYYIERCAYKANGAVLTYATIYSYDSLFRLLYLLKIQPTKRSGYTTTSPKFSNERQESIYYDLRNSIGEFF